jgi:hypothetical protein
VPSIRPQSGPAARVAPSRVGRLAAGGGAGAIGPFLPFPDCARRGAGAVSSADLSGPAVFRVIQCESPCRGVGPKIGSRTNPADSARSACTERCMVVSSPCCVLRRIRKTLGVFATELGKGGDPCFSSAF